MISFLLQGAPPPALPARQKALAVWIALGILVVILELVRRRKLREEYAALWLLTGVLLLLLAWNYSLLRWLTRAVGAVMPVSTLLFLGILFLLLVSLQFSVRLSTTTQRLKDLNQKVALLEAELREHVEGRSGPAGGGEGRGEGESPAGEGGDP